MYTGCRGGREGERGLRDFEKKGAAGLLVPGVATLA